VAAGRWQGLQGAAFVLGSPMARFLNLTEAQNALRTAMLNPSTSEAQVKALHAKVADAQTAVILERRTMMQEFEAILTPDQKTAREKLRIQDGRGPQGMVSSGISSSLRRNPLPASSRFAPCD